ncbi:hypothetical protein FIBSPDRAFT_665092, partial [Athelia psychrophila]
CRRMFADRPALTNHENSCLPSKKRLAETLDDVREVLNDRKRQRVEALALTHRKAPENFQVLDEDEIMPPLAERRSRRQVQLPTRFRDMVPSALAELPPIVFPPAPPLSETTTTGGTSCITASIDSPRNEFGLFRRYHGDKLPTHDPEEHVDLLSLTDSFRKLVNIVGSATFKPEDVRNTKWDRMHRLLGQNEGTAANSIQPEEGWEWMKADAGWTQSTISINVPFNRGMANPGVREFIVGDFHHRSIVAVIREKLANSRDDALFHYEPYELYWQPDPAAHPGVRVQGELYTSPTFLAAHQKLQEALPEPGCTLPRCIVAMQWASDSTHLTSYGNAKVWPCYLYFGNESKYRRGKPTANLCNHVAYFQTLPDSFGDFVSQYNDGKGPSQRLLTHCRRELFHAQWEVILDDEFLEAYLHGIVVKCCDGITRRFYPRIFTYTADYPEKVLIASIRDKGQCPCPRCSMPFSEVEKIGTPEDMQRRQQLLRVDDEAHRKVVESARALIFNKNHAVSSDDVESLLKDESLTPTANAFSRRLAPHGFNIYPTLVVDLMHEFELGVWKGLFIHLLRILEAYDKKTKRTIHEFNRRFRLVPTFGRDTIRRFQNNVSDLKQLAARDYEDILQCAIPVFDGLLPEPHNSAILKLLFTCNHWHGLAKLRMHIDPTLTLLEREAEHLGAQLRQFADETCAMFETEELKCEVDARHRREAKAASKRDASGVVTRQPRRRISESAAGPVKKRYHLRTYKHHCIPDYPRTIREFGATDSFSTEGPELEHRKPKGRYVRTSRKKFIKQMTAIERREARVRRIRQHLCKGKKQDTDGVASNPELHHQMGKTENEWTDMGEFLRRNKGDPAIKDFDSKLKKHLLPRILAILKQQGDTGGENLPPPDSCRAEEVIILGRHNRFFEHHILRVNYTSYDVRRDQDMVNAHSSHCNIMVLCHSCGDLNATDSVSYRYARVIGAYHVNVIYNGPGRVNLQSHRLEFLWVRWYDEIGREGDDWDSRRLSRLHFAHLQDEDAFGFLDPSDVLRGCHIIPRFSLNKVHGDSHGGWSPLARDQCDWKEYYINRFVDRDMLMRYHFGYSVGHI